MLVRRTSLDPARCNGMEPVATAEVLQVVAPRMTKRVKTDGMRRCKIDLVL